MTTTSSIGIGKWLGEHSAKVVWVRGEGDERCIGWIRSDGARAIETNGDPCFEGEDGFESAWAGPTTTTMVRVARPVPEWGREFGADYAVPEWVMVAGVTDRSWHNDACPSFTVDRWGEDPGADYAGRPTLWVEHADPTKREEGMEYRFSLAVADHRHEMETVLETNRTDIAQAVWHWVAVQAMVSPVGLEQVRRVAREITHRLVREAVVSSPEAKRLVNALSGLRGRFGWWHLDDNPMEVEWSGPVKPSGNEVLLMADTMAQARAEFGRLFPREAAITGDWGLWLVAKVYRF